MMALPWPAAEDVGAAAPGASTRSVAAPLGQEVLRPPATEHGGKRRRVASVATTRAPARVEPLAAPQLAQQHARAEKEDDGSNGLGSARFTCRDGRVCKLCGTPDSAPDEVVPGELIYWSRPPRDGFPHGQYDLYCERVFQRRYQQTHPGGIDKFVSVVGSGEALREDFQQWRRRLIDYIRSKVLVDVVCVATEGC